MYFSSSLSLSLFLSLFGLCGWLRHLLSLAKSQNMDTKTCLFYFTFFSKCCLLLLASFKVINWFSRFGIDCRVRFSEIHLISQLLPGGLSWISYVLFLFCLHFWLKNAEIKSWCLQNFISVWCKSIESI